MKYIEVETYEELSRKAADFIAAQILMKPNCVLGLATGSSPEGTYKELIKKFEAGDLDFSAVTTVNLDEYCGLDGSNEQSYRYFMDSHLFNHVNIDKNNTHVPNGLAKDYEAEGNAYDEMIESLGGTDLQLLGIGPDGHIGFNEPAGEFVAPTHCAELEESTIKANSRFFEKIEDVPTRAVSMGMKSIMKAKKILLVANGPVKGAVLKKAIEGPVTPWLPASLLQLHPDCTIIFSKN